MVAALALAALLPSLAAAATCVQFDTAWNLYAFGGENDVNLSAESTWGSPNPSNLATDGRPPFTGNNMQCLLSQYNNAMYVVGADQADASSIYIYDFSGNKWSKQATTSAPSPLAYSRSAVVLDHDTNALYSVPGGGNPMVSLDLGEVTNSAGSSALSWEEVGAPPFNTNNATTAALSNNHITYFGVPGTPAGSANMFVIHFSYFQPEAQAFPTLNGGAAFPDQAGQAVSFPTANNTSPQSMLFVPDDFSNSYVVTHWTNPGDYTSQADRPMAANLVNSTQLLPAPGSKDAQAAYACSPSSCVQIDSKGDIYYISQALGTDFTVNSGAQWTKMDYSLTPASSRSNTSATNSTDTAKTALPAGTASVSPGSTPIADAASGSSTPSTTHNSAVSLNAGASGLVLGAVAVAVASVLSFL